MHPYANSLRTLGALAACLVLGAALAADDSGPAGTPIAATTASGAQTLTPSATSLPTYAGYLTTTVAALGAPLADFLAQSGKPSLSVAAGGFRELVTGERSPLCDHLDKDLTDRLRDVTPYGVPSTLELANAWISIGGNAADMTQPNTVRRFGRLLSVNAVVSGDYFVKDGSIHLTVRLLNCADASVVWTQDRVLPESAVERKDLNTYYGSAPAGYGVQIAAPMIAGLPLGSTPTAAGAPLTRTAADADLRRAGLIAAPPGIQLESNVHETEFSPYRINFSAGYEFFDPLNPAFASVVKNVSGPYLGINWADVFHADLYLWYRSGLYNLSRPISSLSGYGMKISLTAPIRLGHHWVLYTGLGGRFETIDLNLPAPIPSQDAFSFGNNSMFLELGAKAHRGPVGLEGVVDWDLFANYSPYLMVKLGLYYEYSFE